MVRTVLVVEDTDHVAPLEIALSSLGDLSILVLSNGRDALEAIRSNTLELAAVVTDLHLPFVNGFELIQAIRSVRRYASVPIVVMSGDPRPETPALLRSLGANAFFAKPYSPAAIRNSLEALLHAE
jgi:DNA-binding response OmpR family regulator